jgi:uncharacterized protein with FMN-binding domain
MVTALHRENAQKPAFSLLGVSLLIWNSYEFHLREEYTKMSGTKIMVFQLKELIKTGVFALIGLVLIVALILFLLPKDNGAPTGYVPGTYAAQIILHSNPVDIEVTVSDKEIVGIELKNMKTEQEAFYPLFKPTLATLSEQILRYQTTKIATKKETAVTSQILLDAVDAALRQAVADSPTIES